MVDIRYSPFAIRHISTRQRGSVLVFSLFILFFMGATMMAAMSLFTAQVGAMSREHSRIAALHLAEGGVDWALAHLKRSPWYRGDANVPLGDGTFSVSVTRQGNRFMILSTGRVSILGKPVMQSVCVRGNLAGRRATVTLWHEGVEVGGMETS